ncbi:MAG: hypothetical protein KBT53_11165 [Porticoccus sp.]|nr:hypothetical protein [Porticoccus sp.]MBQ0806933.1 hypothetical protein [Porticoccus sp.]
MYMNGFSILILLGLYFPLCLVALWIISFLLKKTNIGRKFRIALIFGLAIMMFLYATWDAVLGKHYLDKFCMESGGVYINSDIYVKGIYLSSFGEPRHAKYFLEKGYQYVEMNKTKNVKDGYVIYRFRANKKTIEEKITFELKSTHTRGFGDPNKKVSPSFLEISLSDQYVENFKTGNKIAGFRNYRMTTRLDRKLRGIGGNVATACTDIKKFKKLKKYEDYSNYHELISKPSARR